MHHASDIEHPLHLAVDDGDECGHGNDGADDGGDEDGDDEQAGGGSLKAECVGDRANCTNGLHDDNDEHDSVKDDHGEADGNNTVGDAGDYGSGYHDDTFEAKVVRMMRMKTTRRLVRMRVRRTVLMLMLMLNDGRRDVAGDGDDNSIVVILAVAHLFYRIIRLVMVGSCCQVLVPIQDRDSGFRIAARRSLHPAWTSSNTCRSHILKVLSEPRRLRHHLRACQA